MTEDGSVELLLNLFVRFRAPIDATLLFQHKADRSGAFSRESRLVDKFGSALVLLELSEASSPESSSLQTRVTDSELQQGSLSGAAIIVVSGHVKNVHAL